MSLRPALEFAGSAALAALALLAGQGACAQVPASPPGAPIRAAQSVAGQYMGVGSCGGAKCHGKQAPSSETAILQNEIEIWKNDPHRRAVAALAKPESKQIASNLKLGSEANESPRCLVCHAVTSKPGGTGAIVDKDQGIACEGCHGPGGGWIDRHNEPTSFKHDESVQRGMFDLRRIEVRATTCLRCHLGDTAGQVDHDLIAAGHPELSFELDTFTDNDQLRHWADLNSLRSSQGRTETHKVRAFIVGQVASLRLSLAFLAERARSGAWPEYAELTCDDCHHALAEGAWRRQRGFLGRAGIPAWNPARWIVARHVMEALAADRATELSTEINAVAEAVADPRHPASEVLAHAERAAALSEAILPIANRFIASSSIPVDTLEKILRAIVSDPDFKRAGDRQSARQIALSVQALIFDGMFYARRPKPSVEKWADVVYQSAFAVDDKGEPKPYDREGFIRALAAMPAVLR